MLIVVLSLNPRGMVGWVEGGYYVYFNYFIRPKPNN